ncbi:penicillin acylase family protein [Streptomyces tateyamensis]|uniref:Penicillin acylase family protein n=1 Tax=Streptomyces tateyamensis TaxID=565073 RepID=A0A2V4NP52_9ACTN|nr:penicillin acylase family protein [Streptomyces tateyamensis]PYC82670.1 penicillin acylase family protein [Streptomyces tateyamensis]
MPRSPRSKKFRRARLIVVVLVVLLVALVAGGGWYAVDTVRASFPQVSGTVKVPGLGSSVDVKRDAQGVPQVYADTPEDLFKAQGYVQAQDRFWEMDVRRHITAGRLSEMFGSGQVDTDAFIRTMGWRDVAQKEWDTQLSADTKKYLQAYTDGVNAWLGGHPGGRTASLEYSLLGAVNSGYQPEQWTPVDSVAWLKAMAWNLSGNLQEEIDRSLLSQTFTPDQIAQLYPDYPYQRNGTILQTGTMAADGTYKPPTAAVNQGQGTAGSGSTQAAALTQGLTSVSDKMAAMPQLLGPQGQGIGSNSWVVAGSHTTTGSPLLANDPHLGPGLPNVWYQMGLHCRSVSASCPYDVTGFTFAGMPGVVIGHNQNITWGLTNLGADVTDLYLEKVTGPDTYLVDNQEVKFETRKETIKVAGGADRVITVRTTNNGPLISDQSTEQQQVGTYAPAGNAAPDRGTSGYGVALRWTALNPGKSMDAIFELDRAADFTHFRAAAIDFAVPSQNLIYADTKGHIGYQAPGQIPVRGKGDGRYPALGWDSGYNWKGYLDFKSLPWVEDPAAGFLVTANQAVVDPSYKPLLTTDWEYGTRAKEITDQIQARLTNGGKISPDDMQSMQLDNTSVLARTLVPMLLKVQVSDPYVKQAQDLLKDWNYNQDADSAAAAYYNGVWRQLLILAFGQKFPAALRPKGDCLLVQQKVDVNQPDGTVGGETKIVTQCGTRKPSQAQPDGGDRWMEVVRQQLGNPGSPWWDYIDSNHLQQHGLDNLLKEAMKDARQDLTAHLGKDVSTWSWGRLHPLNLKEQTLGVDTSSIASGIVHRLLNRGPYQMGGGSAAVDATGWTAVAGYDVDWIPSMRMVVDLSDFNASHWINVGGQSGHAFDDNYDDQTELWQQGKLLPWSYSAAAVNQSTKNTLSLTP